MSWLPWLGMRCVAVLEWPAGPRRDPGPHRQRQRPDTGLRAARPRAAGTRRGPHGEYGGGVAVPGPCLQAKALVERLCAAGDREHVENQVLAIALCFIQKHADDPGAYAAALMAGVEFDARQVDLPRAVVDIQHADIGLPGGDDLPSVRVEGALVKRALDLLVPPPDRRDVLAHGGPVQLVAELGVGGGGGGKGEGGRVLPCSGLPRAPRRRQRGPAAGRVAPGLVFSPAP